jgi:iron(III) transport system ATP-binding protein
VPSWPSGSGKTTLLRIAAGIEAQIVGKGPAQRSRDRRAGRFPAARKALDRPRLPGFRAVSASDHPRQCAFGLTALSRDEAGKEAQRALARVGLEHHARSFPHALSGGEQQRVALARALAPRPSVLLMDEPFSGLDSRLKDSVRAETLAILRESRATAIVVTHDAEEAMRLGDRIALLKSGRLVQAGNAEELYLNPQNLFVAGFFSELNVFRARVRGGMADTPVGKVEAPALAEGSAATVAVRLSGFEVNADAGETQARIISRRYLGVVELIEFAVAGAETPVRARIRCGSLPPTAKDFWLSLRRSDVLVFETGDENE